MHSREVMAFAVIIALISAPLGSTLVSVNPQQDTATVFVALSQTIVISFHKSNNYTQSVMHELENTGSLNLSRTPISSAVPFYGMLNTEVKEFGSYLYVTNLSYGSTYNSNVNNSNATVNTSVELSYQVNSIVENGSINLGWVNAIPSVYYAPGIDELPAPLDTGLNMSWEQSVSQTGISWLNESYNGTSGNTTFTGSEPVSGAFSNSTVTVAVYGHHMTIVTIPGKVNVDGNSLTFYKAIHVNFAELVMISAAISVAVMIAVLLYYRKTLNRN